MVTWLRLKGYVIALLGIISAALAIYWAGRTSGKENEATRQTEIDRRKARTIEDAADSVRNSDGDNATPIERLLKYKRLRDL